MAQQSAIFKLCFSRSQKKILTKEIQTSSICRVLRLLPFRFSKKVNVLSTVIKNKWDIGGTMSDIKGKPV